MFFLGNLEHGHYAEPDLLDVAGGDEELRQQMEQMKIAIEESEGINVHHKPIKAGKARNPFDGAPLQEQCFHHMLDRKAQALDIPTGFGFYASEGQPWNEVDTIKVGKSNRNVTLPEEVWLPRAIVWVRALQTLQYCIQEFGIE